MNLTVPHMGSYWIASKTLFENLGVNVIIPPKTTKRTIELGVKYAPEFACFPLKITLGNFIEAAEQGADTFLIPGGIGPCRFGFYGPVHKEILNDLGYQAELVIGEPPSAGFINLIKGISPLIKNISLKMLSEAGKLSWTKLLAIDHVSKSLNEWRPYEKEKHSLENLKTTTFTKLNKANSPEEVDKIKENFNSELSRLVTEKSINPIRVAIVGEIFLNLDETANQKIEQKLGLLGVEIERSIYLSDWIQENLLPGKNHQKEKKHEIKKLAKPYLNDFVGGHGRESVGEAVLAHLEGLDGVIHVSPFTCMPEITAQGVLPKASNDLNFPIMSLSFDEQTGEAGVNTRLEAFIDLILKKRHSQSEHCRIS
ncbi:acyl-CoA dehydratase activase-related protein [Natranaerobius thermophilus]|uniref:DUF2229 domain-containing protein n=1 Tax=Natranaerobius thermophilus (strain ATCC BAA-1301 / DSM 18059 / JW/NM-WN-LF) TaxID=457570 RepID=B2A5I0_NATTJ|nr:acyl-CoA dehydratase activase-related protein [Natranaerobius thermophilus]ACB85335.1 conserved hypothetical protein [Natranaerobius thermophilus JW/NM-WN-LF]